MRREESIISLLVSLPAVQINKTYRGPRTISPGEVYFGRGELREHSGLKIISCFAVGFPFPLHLTCDPWSYLRVTAQCGEMLFSFLPCSH